MQLLIIFALLLFGGKSGGANVLSEMKPVLESIGGEQMKEAIKNAEQISEVITAVQESAGDLGQQHVRSEHNGQAHGESGDLDKSFGGNSVNFPLAPIALIADKDITYSLSKYIAQN